MKWPQTATMVPKCGGCSGSTADPRSGVLVSNEMQVALCWGCIQVAMVAVVQNAGTQAVENPWP